MAFGSVLGQTSNIFWPQIIVNGEVGTKVTATKNDIQLIQIIGDNEQAIFNIPEYGKWIVSTEYLITETINVDTVKQYFINMYPIYGAEWDGTANTKWTRTDNASAFSDPSPAINNGTGNSPFDNIKPWTEVAKEEHDGNVLVKIPKFYYKWTKEGLKLKLQISYTEYPGFYTSPAHADRGDGKGERDAVYIGRYHCDSSWKSVSGKIPKVNITRADARLFFDTSNNDYWQMDYAIRMTVQMLYLVEFADWDCQKTIGFGCSPGSKLFNTGLTDNMKYHTGTTAVNRTTYGCCQYRYIEGLWDNVYDWMDGCYYNVSGLNIIKNPNSFHDSNNGVMVGRPTNGYPSAMNVSTVSGFEWVIYPSASSGSDITYIADVWNFDASHPCLFVGGDYNQARNRGLFCVSDSGAFNVGDFIGCRLQKLP